MQWVLPPDEEAFGQEGVRARPVPRLAVDALRHGPDDTAGGGVAMVTAAAAAAAVVVVDGESRAALARAGIGREEA